LRRNRLGTAVLDGELKFKILGIKGLIKLKLMNDFQLVRWFRKWESFYMTTRFTNYYGLDNIEW